MLNKTNNYPKKNNRKTLNGINSFPENEKNFRLLIN